MTVGKSFMNIIETSGKTGRRQLWGEKKIIAGRGPTQGNGRRGMVVFGKSWEKERVNHS